MLGEVLDIALVFVVTTESLQLVGCKRGGNTIIGTGTHLLGVFFFFFSLVYLYLDNINKNKIYSSIAS